MKTEIVRFYKGYRLEITPSGVDVVEPWYEVRYYHRTKVSIKEAIRFIRHNPL